MSYIARARNVTQEVEGYLRLRRQVENYCQIPLLDFDEAASTQFEQLRSAKLRVGTMDLKIASIALAQSAILLSRNSIDFERIPGLMLEDWTL